MTPLTRELVARIIAEEAAAVAVTPEPVIHMATDKRASAARRAAMLRIMLETGCTPAALAAMWGCDRQIPIRYAATPTTRESNYDTMTYRRLQWAHGDERAREIEGGKDYRTNADIKAWRRLCSRAGA